MICLNYQKDNPRWGISGLYFHSWGEYALTLGFVSNIQHYDRRCSGVVSHPVASKWNGSISLHIERNNDQGAWNKEGRIHYYGQFVDLQMEFVDLCNCKSAGNSSITCRINSNGYIDSLLHDYGFEVYERISYSTAYILPPEEDTYSQIEQRLRNHFVQIGLGTDEMKAVLEKFNSGWNK